jgi:ACS family tartrate transporter-like MFS transporter
MAIGTSRAGVLADATLVDHTRHQAALRLLPFLFVLYIVSFLDRTSVAYAAIGMSRDLGFSDRVFGLGVGVFFIGYLALQIPGSLLAENWSARRTIAGSMVVWGSLTALTALVHTPVQLYGARFLLGLAEASFFPGVMVYLSHWFIQKDRAKAASNFLAAVPLSLMIGSPVAGWIVGHHWLGIAGWRWLFVLEGMPAVALGAIAFVWLPDWPKDAVWLSDGQREWITRELESEKPADRRGVSVLETLRSGRVLLLGAVAFLAYLPGYAAIFWMPTLLKRQTGLSDVQVGSLLAIPFGVALVAMLFNGWHSDRQLERRWHTAVPLLLGALGTLGLMVFPPSLAITLCLFSLMIVELVFLPVFWAIPTEILSDTAAAGALGVASTIANIAGFLGPSAFGYLHTRTGSLASGYAAMAVSWAASGVLMLMIPGLRRKARDAGTEAELSAEASIVI